MDIDDSTERQVLAHTLGKLAQGKWWFVLWLGDDKHTDSNTTDTNTNTDAKTDKNTDTNTDTNMDTISDTNRDTNTQRKGSIRQH